MNELFQTQLYHVSPLVAVLILNLLAFRFIVFWWKWLNLAVAVFVAMLLVVAGYAMFDTYRSGCYSAPKDVEFKQGMTLCPGQSAHFTVELGKPEN